MPEPAHSKHRLPVPPPTAVRGVSAAAYAELDVTSNFSFLRGASHPDELIYRAAELGHAAIAITDINSLAGVVRAHEAAKRADIRLCVGARLRFVDAPDALVWPEHRAGYAGLCRLLTAGKRRSEKGQCLLHLRDLLEAPEGLLAALAVQRIDPQDAGDSADDLNLWRAAARQLKDAFGARLSLAMTRHHAPTDAPVGREIAAIAQAVGAPLLAVNQAHYHDPSRQPLQDALTCIRHGCAIHEAGFRLFSNAERFIKPPERMHHLFADLPRALHRTIEISERCAFSLEELRYEYPDEIVPTGQTSTSYLAALAWQGAEQRYPLGVPQKVTEQIRHELALIAQLKIEPYFLTVYDLVRFARSRGILCQGRGSAANSAVCYCLGVTSVDPNRIDVLFERFVSAARDEPPDIDIDFEHERREEVIQYVYEKYGRDRAGMTAEVISYRGRSAVRDVGKAMGLGLDAVDQLAKHIDGWHGGAPLDEQAREAGLDPADPTVRRTLALTRELLGFPRHLSQHVGGLIMTRGLLCELVPIENAAMTDRTVIEWDKDDIDALGILKVDVLALGMLTALARALRMVGEEGRHEGTEARRHEGEGRGFAASEREVECKQACESGAIAPPTSCGAAAPSPSCLRAFVPSCLSPPPSCLSPSLSSIPAEDPSVYDMISDADTVGVFQIESRAQMSMLPRLQPRTFYDLVIEVAIVRPGPIQGDMVHPYLRRRQGLEPVSFPKPELEAVLGKTLGVPLFQEQAMKVAMVAAGFTAEQADRLRRAVTGFRRYGDIDAFARQFIEGMEAHGYERAFAERCFNQLKGFASYGFPESHAASFALLVYASAWIKRYHPAAFCCALLNSQPMGFYAPAQLVRDAREHGVPIHPVDVNCSDWDCVLEPPAGAPAPPASVDKRHWGRGGPAVRLGFRMIRGLSETHAMRIAACRRDGAFASVDELHQRSGLSAATIARLAQADVFASLPQTRRAALWDTLALPQRRSELVGSPPPTPATLPAMSEGQEIHADYGSTGLSLKGHPVALVRPKLAARKVITAAQAWDRPHDTWTRVAGIVTVRQRPGTAKGIVFETLEDETGVINLIIRPDVYARHRAAARHARMLQADGYIQRVGKVQHLIAARLYDLSEMLADCLLKSRDFH